MYTLYYIPYKMWLSKRKFILNDYALISFAFCRRHLILYFKDILKLPQNKIDIEEFKILELEKGRDEL